MRNSASSNKRAKASHGRGGRTNIVLDAKLIARVKRLARVGTAREAVHVALEHYARSRDYSKVLALHSTGGVAPGYDPKASSPSRT